MTSVVINGKTGRSRSPRLAFQAQTPRAELVDPPACGHCEYMPSVSPSARPNRLAKPLAKMRSNPQATAGVEKPWRCVPIGRGIVDRTARGEAARRPLPSVKVVAVHVVPPTFSGTLFCGKCAFLARPPGGDVEVNGNPAGFLSSTFDRRPRGGTLIAC
jgi:hypothetical protein